MPRFVLLEHDHPHLHWDLMLEAGEVLRTWRLASPPRADAPVAAEAIGDHRLAYLDYEGPISGGRGRVARREGGTFTWREGNPGSPVEVELTGERLKGTLRLQDLGEGVWEVWYTPAE